MSCQRRLLSVVFTLLLFFPLQASFAQQPRDQNVRVLSKYLAPRTISELEWELLQFNLVWQGSYTGAVDYLTSFPVRFDSASARFRASFRVQERRSYADPKPFFSLSRPERESILRGAVDSFVDLLSQSFPEIRPNPGLVYAEFKFKATGAGFSTVAVYENGRLVLSE